MSKFRTYEESTYCMDFYSGYCIRTKTFCHPDKDGKFPGCGDYFIIPPGSGEGVTAMAKAVAELCPQVSEGEIFAAMQKAAHR